MMTVGGRMESIPKAGGRAHTLSQAAQPWWGATAAARQLSSIYIPPPTI